MGGLNPIACANLPYNITTPTITALLQANCFSAVTVMIQREVALRICAAPGSKDYGAFSIYCQYYTTPEYLFEVPPNCFIPAPKVTSAVVRMVPRPAPAEVDDPGHFFRVVKAAFALRRKTLANSLAANLGSDIAELLAGKKNLSKGVRITVTESSVTVDISLLVKYGSSVQATARAVQEGVAAAIENASGFTVEGVNVHVAGVTFERPARTNQ